MNAPAIAADAPEPGSIHFFAEIYAGPGRHEPLRAVHALEAGVRASLRPGIDHQVAHARLEWWRQEAARAGAGAPEHPLAARLAAAAGRDALAAALQGWVQSAQADLAGAQAGDELQRALAGRAGAARFALIAALLEADAGAAQALGAAAARLRRNDAADAGARAAACAALTALAPDAQPPLRPLLVWSVLALRRARLGEAAPPERAAPGRRAWLADNWHAWRAARAADAGLIHRIPEVSRP
ncbi:MAG: hypothetical protein U1F06_06810 [Steroidobacteraceae bacterium]